MFIAAHGVLSGHTLGPVASSCALGKSKAVRRDLHDQQAVMLKLCGAPAKDSDRHIPNSRFSRPSPWDYNAYENVLDCQWLNFPCVSVLKWISGRMYVGETLRD